MLLVLCISLLSVVSATVWSYGVMIDAGSTGTRAHIYKWSPRETSSATPPNTLPELETKQVEAMNSCDHGQGLSSHVHDVTGAQTDIQALVDCTKKLLKEHTMDLTQLMAETPIFLAATAGMRLVPFEGREKIMAVVRETLSKSGYKFESTFARIISGEEEGAYGWLSVNYIQQTLGADPEATWTALDLGGASTQITMASNAAILSQFFPLSIPSTKSRSLYTNSYLHFGVNEAEVLVAESLNASLYTVNVQNPCFNRGNNNFTVHARLGNVTMDGAGDYEACLANLTAIMGKSETCYYDDCGLNGVYQPSDQEETRIRNVIAFSSFGYSAAELGHPTNLTQWESATKKVCQSTWEDLKNSRNATSPTAQARLGVLCFNAAYSYTLLTQGYGFHDNTTRFVFTNTITTEGGDEYSTGWTLGAMLYQAALLEWELKTTSSDSLSDTASLTILFLLVAVMMLCCYLVGCVWCKSDKQQFEGYREPLIA